ncbi:MAG: hypothetical protein M5T61_10375 [Acidimicrobiia bacterium]|nr:hypothetical protein [Acidimicrobiia bacterium]
MAATADGATVIGPPRDRHRRRWQDDPGLPRHWCGAQCARNRWVSDSGLRDRGHRGDLERPGSLRRRDDDAGGDRIRLRASVRATVGAGMPAVASDTVRRDVESPSDCWGWDGCRGRHRIGGHVERPALICGAGTVSVAMTAAGRAVSVRPRVGEGTAVGEATASGLTWSVPGATAGAATAAATAAAAG